MSAPSVLPLLLGVPVIAAAVYAVFRRVDVRLALLPAALALGVLAGRPEAIVRAFLATLASPNFVVPICCSMGFAYVLKHTGCDLQLVQLLTRPLRRVRALLLPGTVLLGYTVNIPIISQASTAAALGPVLIPLLTAARIAPMTAGAALLLGASIGGELLNPGAPEYATVVKEVNDRRPGTAPVLRSDCVMHMAPFTFAQVIVATGVFWALTSFGRGRREDEPKSNEPVVEENATRVNYLKAAIPLLPLAILFLTSRFVDPQDPSRTYQLVALPVGSLVDPARDLAGLDEPTARRRADELFDARLIGAAMLIGSAVAVLVSMTSSDGRRRLPDAARSFFEGAGYAFKEIIAIIVVATCFAEGVKLIGVGDLLGRAVAAAPGLLLPTAALVMLAFAFLSGSGFAAMQGLFGLFVAPALAAGIDPIRVGVVASLGAAAGRTISPAAAVNLVCARMTGAAPADLVRRVVRPVLAGLTAAVVLAMLS